ncbi:Sulfide dehydrogenase (flavocytochrome c) flavoprotein chain [Candidatus Terasakiella magnetica]|uniref:Sulfide dehydrogenase (Flavocytochrome c) flavoprotein chain n=1 Tax=Candidatus Terasakiella magnetica TaxID=1867952 RepID=A0A1C3RJP9_9PROT|nr:NAD(P)/FAD-dependent oxidoreductase [Candidatus Terasakiella magnetica]SCA57453.1 Sulfide dehydrogenase (flavocytochrome c) flavoprotein chain [Candidatus Terasakiella magnetica]
MTKFNRRSFLQLTGAAAVTGAAVMSAPSIARAAGKKVVIVGGGPAGATVANYLRMMDMSIEVTLIEADKNYFTCFMSNEVLGGKRSMDGIKQGYMGLEKAGVKVVHDMVTGIDGAKKKVMTKGGQTFEYDRCVVAPGVDFKFDKYDGLDANVAETKIPHAWKAGPQTALLRKQLEEMKDGGTFTMVAPPNPFRCPPGPYERVSLIANYFKKEKPKSKILIIDHKDKFSKQGLFTQAWKKFYGYGTDNSMIEWIKGSDAGQIEGVDVAGMAVKTDFEEYKGDVINFIPAQKAGPIAFAAGLTDASGWCPVDKVTFESKQVPGIHVLGDAAIATKMPKSGYAANSQGKVTAAAIAAALNGKTVGVPSYVNTCYSIAADDWAFSVAAVYKYDKEKDIIAGVKGAGGLSPMDASAEDRKREVAYAHSWYDNICKDIWG